MRKFWFLTLILLLVHGPVFASDGGPDPKDHVFNPDLPTQTEGEMVTLATKSGLPFQVYEILPRSSSPVSVLLVHEWWGLNDHMKATADQLALLGYNALAVDLYGGKATDNPDEAGKLMGAVNPDEAQSKLEAALEYLAAKSQKIAVMGWCFGGGWALKASVARPDLVDATVIYYGELISDPDKLARLRGPVLGIFAKRDGWITPQWVDTFKTALEKAGVRHEIYSYDADHAFANPSNKHFNEEAYKDAWSKTLDFLKNNLHGR